MAGLEVTVPFDFSSSYSVLEVQQQSTDSEQMQTYCNHSRYVTFIPFMQNYFCPPFLLPLFEGCLSHIQYRLQPTLMEKSSPDVGQCVISMKIVQSIRQLRMFDHKRFSSMILPFQRDRRRMRTEQHVPWSGQCCTVVLGCSYNNFLEYSIGIILVKLILVLKKKKENVIMFVQYSNQS